MKRALAFTLAGLVACVSFGAQAQSGHSQHDQGNRKSHTSNTHASRDHGSFKQGGKSHDYRKGQRLPSQYRGKSHYVTNYSSYHLKAPPRGYHWVRDDGGNFMLVALTTGLIAQILSGN